MFRDKTDRVLVIDLTGPEGNAFHLLAVACRLAARSDQDIKLIHTEMMSGNYEHLLVVFEKYFGDWVILER